MKDWRPEFVRLVRKGLKPADAARRLGLDRSTPYQRLHRGDLELAADLAEAWPAARRASERVSTDSAAA